MTCTELNNTLDDYLDGAHGAQRLQEAARIHGRSVIRNFEPPRELASEFCVARAVHEPLQHDGGGGIAGAHAARVSVDENHAVSAGVPLQHHLLRFPNPI